jgi:integrase
MDTPQRKPRNRANGDGSLYRRASDGRWCASLVVGRLNGKPVRRTWYGATQSEARAQLKTAIAELAAGAPLDADRITVGEWLKQWQASRAHVYRYQTRRNYAFYLASACEAFGEKRLRDLSVADVSAWIASLSHSPRTIRMYLSTLRIALRAAQDEGICRKNVAALSDAPPCPRYVAKVLTPEQTLEFLRVASTHRLSAMWLVAATLGMRRGELCGLRWQDVDLQAGTIAVETQWLYLPGLKQLAPLKTDPSRRVIELPDAIRRELAAHAIRQAREREIVGSAWKETGHVFVGRRGKPFPPSSIWGHFHRVLTSAGLPLIRLHDLRHGAATVLHYLGVTDKQIQALLGHGSLAVTTDTYTHLQENSGRAVAAAIDRFLLPVATPVTTRTRKRPVN